MKVVILLYGGLGNQLFQYVMGVYIRNKYNADVSYDLSSFGLLPTYRQYELSDILRSIPTYSPTGVFFSKYTYIKRRLLQYALKIKPGVCYVNELRDRLDEGIFTSSKYNFVYLDGYWQSKKYFEWCYTNIPKFNIKPWTDVPSVISDDIAFITSNKCISMHIRRGDYLQKENAAIMAACTPDYFKKSLLEVCIKEPHAKLVIFSDDPGWVRENLHFDIETRIIDHKNISPIWDIYMMSLCKHHIMSNSTFSWWGSVLNHTSETITVVPERWFNYRPLPPLYLDTWIKVAND